MNFAPGLIPPGHSSICAEIAHSAWRSLDIKTASEQVIPDLRRAGILRSDDIAWIVDVENIEYAYVVYDHRWRTSTDALKVHLRSAGLIPCGRFGEWAYLWMHDFIQSGKRAAQELESGLAK